MSFSVTDLTANVRKTHFKVHSKKIRYESSLLDRRTDRQAETNKILFKNVFIFVILFRFDPIWLKYLHSDIFKGLNTYMYTYNETGDYILLIIN